MINNDINAMTLEEFKSRINNSNFSIIARDCIAGYLYHQLGLRFLTPTINLFFSPIDFNYFCLHLKKYLKLELIELKDESVPYPVGILKPRFGRTIRVDFMHYNSFIEAKEKWDDRKSRVNFRNIFVISTFCYPRETKTLSKELIKSWKKIKYKKVMIVDKSYGFKNEFIIEKPSDITEYAWLLAPLNNDEWRKVFNKFDFINFLSSK